MERDFRTASSVDLLWSLRRNKTALPELTKRAVVVSVISIVNAGIYLNKKASESFRK